ncbi:MAG: HAD-IIB family hydrolase [Bermanella sp.]
MSQLELSQFLQEHQLGRGYTQQTSDYFAPLARELANLHQNKKQTIIVGINGAQGSGKSTLSELLVKLFETQYSLNAVTLSLDDFYYTHSERQHLAHNVHPLFSTRGVPGTHDVLLAHETLDQLLNHNGAKTIHVPRFNKATDDRYEASLWSPIKHKPDIIILEGWCIGACAQNEPQLLKPVNALEEHEDEAGTWRHYVNQQLATQYQGLFDRLECIIMLKAPSFQCVYNWRLEQEQKLIGKLKVSHSKDTRTMNETQIQRFIQHYQRITEHLLETLPKTAQYVFELNAQRKIQARKKQIHYNDLDINALIFTDLDGSLLDHHSYSHQAADIALTYLQENSIPVIPCSSKTQPEIESLRLDLNNQHPFIIENGAAVFIPKHIFADQPHDTIENENYWVKEFVEPHAYWLSKLNLMRDEFNGLYKPFSDMTIEEIAQATDLSLEQAGLAAKRQYGEPVLWLGNQAEKQAFIKRLKDHKVNVLQGGRFLHVCGDANKGKALLWLSNTYQELFSASYSTIAIGDSHNDCEMLDMADHALIIRSPVHDIPSLSRVDGVTISDAYGPEGWAQGINSILDTLFSRAY